MKRVWTYIPTVVVAGTILYLSLMRDVHISFAVTIPHIDKVVHILMYLTLSVVLMWDLHRDKCPMKRAIIWSTVLPTVYGGVIELLQEYYFPPRTGDVWDWMADIFGVFIGSFVMICVWKRKTN